MTESDPRTKLGQEIRQKVQRRLHESSLEPLEPQRGLDLYLRERRSEMARASIKTHRSRLKPFTEYCEQEGLDNLNELTGRFLHKYRLWRREQGGLNPVSEKHSQYTLRAFMRFLGSIDAVPPNLVEKVMVPSLSRGEGVRDELVGRDRLKEILTYLGKYRYASLEHVIWILLSELGARIGTVLALDTTDYYPESQPPRLEIRHRPGETPLKNQERAERSVALSAETVQVLDDFLADRHPRVDDEYERTPIIGTQHGRAADSTVRRCVYRWTRPCVISGGECPHNRDMEDCQAAQNGHHASACPSSKPPSTVRRGYLTMELQDGVPIHIIGDRADVTEAVLREHYDQREETERMSHRKEIIETAHEGGSLNQL